MAGSRNATAEEARTPIMGDNGFRLTSIDTTPQYIDLTAYVNRFVTVVSDTDVYLAMGSATGFTMNVSGAASVETAGVALPHKKDNHYPIFVDADNPWLGVRTVSGTGATLTGVVSSNFS